MNVLSSEQLIFALTSWVFLTSIVYTLTGWRKVYECYQMWFTREYWTDYNIIEPQLDKILEETGKIKIDY